MIFLLAEALIEVLKVASGFSLKFIPQESLSAHFYNFHSFLVWNSSAVRNLHQCLVSDYYTRYIHIILQPFFLALHILGSLGLLRNCLESLP